MMGSGKSSVGRALASALGVPFVDLDVRVERMFGSTIGEAFARGESHFRGLERSALTSLLREPGFAGRAVVVATGGGAVLDPRSRAGMDAAGVRVLLRVPVAELAARLSAAQGEGRPLLGDAEDPTASLTELWAQRREAYEDGSHPVDGVGSLDTVVHRIAAALNLRLQPGEAP